MRQFSMVVPGFWVGPTGIALRAYPAEVRELAFYLATCPAANQYGLFYLPLPEVIHETGRPETAIRHAFDVLLTLRYAEYDYDTQWVFVYQMAQVQCAPLPLKALDWRATAAAKWYARLQKNPFLGDWFDRYRDDFHLTDRRDWKAAGQAPPSPEVQAEVPAEPAVVPAAARTESAPGKGLSHSQSPSQSEHEPEPAAPAGNLFPDPAGPPKPPPDLFLVPVPPERWEEFWNLYPKHVGKKVTKEIWKQKVVAEGLAVEIIEGVKRHLRSERWAQGAIPDPERYLKHERWKDDLSERPVLNRRTTQMMRAGADFIHEGPCRIAKKTDGRSRKR